MIMTKAFKPAQGLLVDTLYMKSDELSLKAMVTSKGKGVVAHSGPAKGKEYSWIRLNQTIFHPHGGGQLSDKGTINGLPVVYVNKEHFPNRPFNEIEIQHCFAEDIPFEVGEEVALEVEKETREANSKWHTAAHVVDYLVVKAFPQLTGHSGQCYPGDAFMKFDKTLANVPTEDGARKINRLKKEECPTEEEVKKAIKEGIFKVCALPLEVVYNEGVRKLKIGDHPINCGGTHVHQLTEIGKLEISTVKYEKEGTLRIRYMLA